MNFINTTESTLSTTEELEELYSMQTPSFINDSRDQNATGGIPDSAAGASIVSPIVMFLAGLIGNVLALVVLHKTKKEIRNMMFYTLVAALTWNDLIGICLTSPPVLAAYVNGRQMPALPMLCRFHALAMVCFGLSTPFIVCAMALERSLALHCPYFYCRHCTPSAARLLVALLWALVLFFGALPLMGVGSFTLQYPKTWCFLHFRSYTPLDMAYAGAYAVLNVLVIIVMVFCNGLVITALCRVRKSRKRNRRMSDVSSNGTLLKGVEDKVDLQQQVMRGRHHRHVELQMIWLLCAITTIFSVCWAPLMVYILYCLQSPTNSSPVFGLVAVRLASLNQTINPWIYVILRKSLLSRLTRICCHYRLPCIRHFGQDIADTSSQKLEPRRPTGYHKAAVLLQNKAAGETLKGAGNLKNKYVHVGNQLCPSSQFVGLSQPVRLVSRVSGQRSGGGSASGGGGESGDGGRGGESKSSSRSQRRQGQSGGMEAASETGPAPAEISSGGVCSACHDSSLREELQGVVETCRDAYAPSSDDSPNDALSAPCSAAAADFVSGSCPSHCVPADGAYVDFFRHLAFSGVALHEDVIHNEVKMTPCRAEGCGADVTSFSKVPSTVSEADDHGYSSSSRVSTPERCRPDISLALDPTQWSAEADAIQMEVGSRNCLDPSSRSAPLLPTQTVLKDQVDGSVPKTDREDTNDMSVCFKGSRCTETCFNQRDPKGWRQGDNELRGSDRDPSTPCQDVGCTPASASADRTCTNGTANGQHLKHNGCPRRDDSLDLTSGIFDCRDDNDDGDDDDVYDDSLSPAQSSKEEWALMTRCQRKSSSRTMSSSSAGTVVDT